MIRLTDHSVLYVCLAVVLVFCLSQCGSKTDPVETAAVATACAKIGMAVEVTNRAGSGISMRCVRPAGAVEPAASGVR